jgi:hypothetical protein
MNNQLHLLPQDETKPKMLHERVCENCNKTYQTAAKASKFCSDSCRGAAWRKSKGTQEITISTPKNESPAQAASPLLTGLNPQLQIAIDLLKKEADRWEKKSDYWEKKYNDEAAQRQALEKAALQKEHATALQGLENAKPDLIDRVLNGLSSMPPSIVEQFAPLIGRLGNLLVPGGASAPVEGVQGQLDEPQIQFINWINSLPPETQKNFLVAMAQLSSFDGQKLNTTINQIIQLLKSGSSMQSHNMSMYGN